MKSCPTLAMPFCTLYEHRNQTSQTSNTRIFLAIVMPAHSRNGQKCSNLNILGCCFLQYFKQFYIVKVSYFCTKPADFCYKNLPWRYKTFVSQACNSGSTNEKIWTIYFCCLNNQPWRDITTGKQMESIFKVSIQSYSSFLIIFFK